MEERIMTRLMNRIFIGSLLGEGEKCPACKRAPGPDTIHTPHDHIVRPTCPSFVDFPQEHKHLTCEICNSVHVWCALCPEGLGT